MVAREMSLEEIEESGQPLNSQADGEEANSQSHNFDLVFVLPLPSTATVEAGAKFEAKHLTKEHPTYADIIRHVLLTKMLRDSVSIGVCDNLMQAQNCVIELLTSFFESLAESLNAGVELFMFSSENAAKLFLCVRVSESLAEAIAQMDEYPLQLRTEALEELHIKLSGENQLVPAYVVFGREFKKGNFYQPIADPQNTSATTVLRTVDHVRLLYAKVTEHINIHELQRMGLLTDVFCDHNKSHLLSIRNRWARLWLLFSPSQPIEDLRDYFGEGLAFYFLFVGFMIQGLLVLMLPALACFLVTVLDAGYAQEVRTIFSIIVVMWSTILVKLWVRQRTYYCNKWGMDRHQAGSGILEPLNPDFHGSKQPSLLDENILILQPDRFKRTMGFVISGITSIAFTSLIVCGVVGNRVWASEAGPARWTLCALVLSAQIQVGEKLWDNFLVEPLNRLEEHVTLYSYDQSRVAKSFVIKFVNSSIAFLYMAYIQPLVDRSACGMDCTLYLRRQLIVFFATYISFGLLDCALPYLRVRVLAWWQDRQTRVHGLETFQESFLEQQAMMSEYTGADEQDAFLAIVLPLAFVLMFGPMAPATVILAYVSFACQLRGHAWKFSTVSRRTFPVRAQGIGTWEFILPWLVTVGNSNCICMMIVYSDRVCALFPGFRYLTDILEIEGEGRGARLILFFILQLFAIAWCRLLDVMLSDIPAQTRLEMERQNLQRNRLAQRNQSEIHEQISLVCSGDVTKCAFHTLPPLQEGHELYAPPILT